MKARVPCSIAFVAVLLMLAAEGLAFLPSARAQAAQAGAAVSAQPRGRAERQLLRGHVPAVLARLQPLGRLVATNRLKLAIGLPLRNPEALAQLLQQLSDPAHPNYRHYLTPEEFAAKFGPTEQDYAAVIVFAQANGLAVRGTHPNRTLLDVSGSVADIENAFHVTMHVYQHPAEARTFYAPDGEPSLDLAAPVLGISGLNNYALPRPRVHATRLESRAGVSPAPGSNAGRGRGAGETPALLSEYFLSNPALVGVLWARTLTNYESTQVLGYGCSANLVMRGTLSRLRRRQEDRETQALHAEDLRGNRRKARRDG